MLQPPPLRSLPRYPVTATIAAASLAVTAAWWLGQDLEGIVMNGRVWTRWELWRALTTILPHVNVFHLAFNLYWLWALGTVVERVYGHFRFAAIVILLALTSSLAEFALLSGGVGLSGVGYGLWGLLWVLDRYDPRFAGAMDQQTSQMFIAWFLLCIVLTVTHIMPVANIAHGVGALTGALLGLAVSRKGKIRLLSLAGLAATLILGVAGATVFWPRINLSKYAQSEVERAGVEALDRSDNAKAARLLEIAARMRRAPAYSWYNLGIAYQRLGRFDDALAAFEHAAEMPGADNDFRKAAAELRKYVDARKGKL
jgi:membrane associated rhomboid family serine protease